MNEQFQLTRRITNAVRDTIRGMTNAELVRAQAECGRLSPLNCSWVMYEMRRVMADIILDEKRDRDAETDHAITGI